MDFEQIKELITLVDSSNLAFFELSSGNDHIKMDKSLSRGAADNNFSSTNNSGKMPVPTVEKVENINKIDEVKKEIKQNVAEENVDDSNLSVITSPMVGTFYSSASPESPAFIKAGDTVSKGKVICIIEAMKLMNEIESDYDGEVVECLIKDGDMVEYGQPLFKIKEA